MAQRVWITAFATSRVQAAAPFAELPPLKKYAPLDLTGGTAQSLTLDPQTRYFRVVAEVQCALSTTGTATANDVFIPPMRPEYFGTAAKPTTVSVIAAP